MEHTKEPWEAHGNGIHQGTICIAITHVSPKGQAAIDAKRIVDCVNACSGIADPERFVSDARSYSHETVSAIVRQRDELLAALKDTLRSCRKDFSIGAAGDEVFRTAYAQQFEAIANAKGA